MKRSFKVSTSLVAFVFMTFVISGCKWPFGSQAPKQEVPEEVDENPAHGVSDESYEVDYNQGDEGDEEDVAPKDLENEDSEANNSEEEKYEDEGLDEE